MQLRNFEDWAKRCSYGLLALGATDPVRRFAQAKANDPLREHHAAIFKAWHGAHGTDLVTVKELSSDVAELIAPRANRQALAPAIRKLVGMRVGNMQIVVARQATNNTPTAYQPRVDPD